MRAWLLDHPADLLDWCMVYGVQDVDTLILALTAEDRDFLNLVSSNEVRRVRG